MRGNREAQEGSYKKQFIRLIGNPNEIAARRPSYPFPRARGAIAIAWPCQTVR